MKKKRVIQEGGIDLILPHREHSDDIARKSEIVFYNPDQVFNRDISVLALRTYSKLNYKTCTLNVCDAFAASGIRGLRYAKDIENINKIVFNDLNSTAVKLIQKNIAENINKLRTSQFEIVQKDAARCLARSNIRFDIVDIDPFGSPARYIYPSTINLNNNGLLCLTATDMTVLTGIYPEKLFKDYGITHIQKSLSFCHEIAVRILISAAQKIGLQQRFGLYPILSFAADHYIRVFLVRQRNKKKVVNETGFIAYCTKCDFRETLELNEYLRECPSCNIKMKKIGPLWIGSTADKDFVQQCLSELDKSKLDFETRDRMYRFFKILEVESQIDVPWYYSLHSICENHSELSPPPKREFLDFLKEKYPASLTIYSPISIKTTLTANQIREEIRKYHSSNDIQQ